MPIKINGHPRFMKKYEDLEGSIKRKVDDVLDSLKAGDKGDYIQKILYPKLYRKDGVKNLYRYEILSYRLIYTIVGREESKTFVILDFLTHKEYDVMFGYHTS
ncbi:MAG: hypothetical protein ACRD9Q_09785 [Nitrososphaeraceae archaeon]